MKGALTRNLKVAFLCALRVARADRPLQTCRKRGNNMSIYHCSISNVSRAKGSSSCATLSYISADKVYEERTTQTYSYGRGERVLEVGTILPAYAPKEYADASVLFNAIENYEKAENARTAKKIEVALPRELDLETQKEIVENYIREYLTSEGYCATYAIHNDKDNNNPHAHILVANRQLNKKGKWGSKRKMKYALDEKGERIPRLDENGQQKTDKHGRKQWVRINVEQNPLDKKEFLERLREGWAKECNRHLEPEQQIDHRSYETQGKDQIPTIHEGYASREIEARGGISERAEINRDIREKNSLIKQLSEQLKELGARLKEKGAQTFDRIGELLQRSRSARADQGIGTEHRGQRESPERELGAFFRSLNTKERASEEKSKDSLSQRGNREAEQQRLRAEAGREALERQRTESERIRKKITKSRGHGPSL